MEKVTEYKLIAGQVEAVQTQVQESIKVGWQPLGSVSYAFHQQYNSFYCAQAMVKYADSSKAPVKPV